MDATYRDAGAPFEQAVHVVAAIRSLVDERTAIVDAGLKALSTDMGFARVAGLDATYRPSGDEQRQPSRASSTGAARVTSSSSCRRTRTRRSACTASSGSTAEVALPVF